MTSTLRCHSTLYTTQSARTVRSPAVRGLARPVLRLGGSSSRAVLCTSRRIVVRRAEGGDKPAAGAEGAGAESKVGGEEEPIWVKREREAAARAGEDKDLPYGVYLLFSSIIVIAVVGSCFELANQNPVFGVVGPDSPLYLPILGVFILTGLPTAGVLWNKAITAANAETERQDKMDGYR